MMNASHLSHRQILEYVNAAHGTAYVCLSITHYETRACAPLCPCEAPTPRSPKTLTPQNCNVPITGKPPPACVRVRARKATHRPNASRCMSPRGRRSIRNALSASGSSTHPGSLGLSSDRPWPPSESSSVCRLRLIMIWSSVFGRAPGQAVPWERVFRSPFAYALMPMSSSGALPPVV